MTLQGQTMSVLDLPTTVLALCLEHLDDPKDLAKACCVCRVFKEAGDSSPSWRIICGHWRHWHVERYAQLQAARDYKAIYPLKCQADARTRAALASLVYPRERFSRIRELKELGADAKDVMLSDCAAPGSVNIGQRYWAMDALTRCNAADCARQLEALLREREPDVLRGALIIASALDPGAEAAIASIPGRVAQLAAELRRRMNAASAGDDLEGLKLLKQLLFGQRPGGFALDDTVPPAGAGLQLRGNRDDYYAQANSLLHKVFETGLGIPISLSLIAVAVGWAAGLSMHCVNAPGHFMAKLAPDGMGPVHYLDAFENSIMDRRDMQQVCAALGVPPALLDTPPSAAKVLHRMCINLIKIFENTREFDNTRTVLELLCVIEPDSCYIQADLAQMCLLCGDPDACFDDLLTINHDDSPEIAAHVIDLSTRAQMEKSRLVEQAALRHKRSEFPAVLHRVGDVIRHRRYGYKGVIYGWDESCKASAHWCQAMNIDALPGGRSQPFYNVLVDARQRPGSSTYVAQENIEVTTRADGEEDDSFLVQSDDVGERFDGIEQGGSRYMPNAYFRTLYPEDV